MEELILAAFTSITARDGCETVDIICNDTEYMYIVYFEVFLCVCVHQGVSFNFPKQTSSVPQTPQ